MSCPNCKKNLLSGIYYCDSNDYRIIDNLNDKNLIFIFKPHDLPSGDTEINDSTVIKYCNFENCNYFRFMDDLSED